jgi:hypothetical protein
VVSTEVPLLCTVVVCSRATMGAWSQSKFEKGRMLLRFNENERLRYDTMMCLLRIQRPNDARPQCLTQVLFEINLANTSGSHPPADAFSQAEGTASMQPVCS